MKFQNLSVKRLFSRVAMGLALSMSGITIALFLVTKHLSISVFMSQPSLCCRLRDAEMVFSMSMARVIGPTPPGTGVI